MLDATTPPHAVYTAFPMLLVHAVQLAVDGGDDL